MISLSQGKFSTFDGIKLHYRYFKNSEARDTLILLHGHGEHTGRYEKFARHLSEERLSLAFFDGRGYGLSEGFHCYAETYEHFLRDLSAFVGFLEKEHQLLKKFYLFGHSNGALTAIHWALAHKDRLKGLFLSSPYLGLKVPGVLIQMNRLIDWFHPQFMYQNPVYPPYLTHSAEELAVYKKDTLIRRKITARLVLEMIRYHRILQEMPEISFPFPVYVLMSGLDRVVDASKTKLFYERLQAPEKDLKVFPDLYHEIFNERGQDQVFDSLREQIAAAKRWNDRNNPPA